MSCASWRVPALLLMWVLAMGRPAMGQPAMGQPVMGQPAVGPVATGPAGNDQGAQSVIVFTARIGATNSVDTGDLFGQGFGANLAGQVLRGRVVIDPAKLVTLCNSGGGCYGDFGAGAVSMRLWLGAATVSVLSSGTLGYYGGRSGGAVSVSDLSNGGYNYLSVAAAAPNGAVQVSLGALFGVRTGFDASLDPVTAVSSLSAIGGGWGLVAGGVTLLNPVTHLDATLISISDVPEPSGLAVVGVGVVGLAMARRRRRGCRTEADPGMC